MLLSIADAFKATWICRSIPTAWLQPQKKVIGLVREVDGGEAVPSLCQREREVSRHQSSQSTCATIQGRPRLLAQSFSLPLRGTYAVKSTEVEVLDTERCYE